MTAKYIKCKLCSGERKRETVCVCVADVLFTYVSQRPPTHIRKPDKTLNRLYEHGLRKNERTNDSSRHELRPISFIRWESNNLRLLPLALHHHRGDQHQFIAADLPAVVVFSALDCPSVVEMGPTTCHRTRIKFELVAIARRILAYKQTYETRSEERGECVERDENEWKWCF